LLDRRRRRSYYLGSEIDVNPQAIAISRDRKPATFVVDMEVSP
jgi:hypothetical protein